MALRWMSVAVICLALSPDAFAAERTGLLHRVSCTVVRYYVAKYSAPAAEAWARSKGATEAEIETARHCIGADSTQTVQAASWSAH
jgi:hypothetical protein